MRENSKMKPKPEAEMETELGIEGKKTCCICKKKFVGFGNTPSPLAGSYCCSECDKNIVIPVRIYIRHYLEE